MVVGPPFLTSAGLISIVTMITTDLIKHVTGEYDLEIVAHLKLTCLVSHRPFFEFRMPNILNILNILTFTYQAARPHLPRLS
jgi:hypothetical protein